MGYHEAANDFRNVINQDYAKKYREADEREIETENHERLCNLLRDITIALAPGSTALDLGCGPGRYFHCLRNIGRLTAADLSINMLRQARKPVRREAISVPQVDLVCANVSNIQLRVQFDFIYSIGVFGEHVSWDAQTSNRLFDALKPGGSLFFTVVDVFSKYPDMTRKRQMAETVNLFLPVALKQRLRNRLGTFYVTRRQLIRIFKKTHFQKYEIHKHVSTARLWRDVTTTLA